MKNPILVATCLAALIDFSQPALAQSTATTSAVPAPDGEVLFRQRCQMCHSIDPARPSTMGPSLRGVVGRKAAATRFAYSPAMAKSGLTWSRANIDRFLTAPTRTVPGTRMQIAVADPRQRAAIVTYLARLR